jgi:hypothetical protein
MIKQDVVQSLSRHPAANQVSVNIEDRDLAYGVFQLLSLLVLVQVTHPIEKTRKLHSCQTRPDSTPLTLQSNRAHGLLFGPMLAALSRDHSRNRST